MSTIKGNEHTAIPRVLRIAGNLMPPIFGWFGGRPEDRPPIKQHVFNVKLNCANCCAAVKKAVEGRGGVHNVKCDLADQQVTIEGWLTREEAEECMAGTGKAYSHVA